MAIANANKEVGRQYKLTAIQPFDYTELENGAAVVALKVPAGARVTGGLLVVETVWDGTTPTVDIGDDLDTDRYSASPISLAAAAATALTVTGYKYLEGNTIDLLLSVTGSPSQGSAQLIVEYVVDGRANEVVPDYT